MNNDFNNGYEESTNETEASEINSGSVTTTRLGRKIHKPSKYVNYSMLLIGLIASQFVNQIDNNFELNKEKHLSFFKAQIDCKQATNVLLDGTNN